MDDKAGRRSRAKVSRWRFKKYSRRGKNVLQVVRAQKNTILTSLLLLLAVVLVFAVFGQLKPPTNVPTVPSGMMDITYSGFLEQVNEKNVLAVVLRDNVVEALLVRPLGQQLAVSNKTSAPSQKMVDAEVAAWNRYIRSVNLFSMPTVAVPRGEENRTIYTQMPLGGDAQLPAFLVTNHVQFSTLPVTTANAWGLFFWRMMPLLVILLAVSLFFSRRKTRVPRSADERFAQLSKGRARRYDRGSQTGPSFPGQSDLLKQRLHDSPKKAAIPTAQASKVASARVRTPPDVTFADVAGIDEVRCELEEIVQFLRTPQRYARLGAQIPRGALLVGAPGTGKTLLAKAVAGEAGVPFFSMSASEFVEMFVGVGASRVRELFQQARQAAPAVIFIDEIDAVGRKRSVRAMGSDERDQTLNQLLVELDGFDTRQAVVVLAATNRVDILDKALLRPGRFDRHISISLPDRPGREAILRVHTRKVPLHEDVELGRLARMTTSMSGADLANLVNEAALSAARRDMEAVNFACFEEALARVQLGALRPLVLGEKERRIIAYHESGHALVAYHLPEADTVNRVTILPRGQSLGVTQFTAEEDRYNYSREALMAQIAVGLGGRVAEELTFGPERITTGAENDLQRVTDLARRMVTRWGMSEQIGVVFADYRAESDYSLNMRRIQPGDMPGRAHALVLDRYGDPILPDQPVRQQRFALSAAVSQNVHCVALNALVDAEVQRILNQGREMARTVLTAHQHELERLAAALIEHEQLDRVQFEDLLQV